jgi:hypothetical protein
MVEGIERPVTTRPDRVVPLDDTRPASFLKGEGSGKNFRRLAWVRATGSTRV